MTLKTLIAADATAVFLNTDELAYTATHRKPGSLNNPGDLDNTEPVTLLVFWDEDQNSRSGPGSLNADRNGRRTLHSVLVELSGDVTVTPEKSQFVLSDDTVLTALKSAGRDLESGMQTWECNYSDGISTLKPRIRPG